MEAALIARCREKLGLDAAKEDDTGVHPDQRFTLQELYPPCTTALADLETMAIADLQTDTHHRGKVLWLRKVREDQVFAMASKVAFIVADHMGSGDVLEIPLSHLEVCWDDLQTPYGSIAVAVKEPFYTRNEHGAYVIRADHPSDLIATHLPHPLAPRSLNEPALQEFVPTALELKAEGNSKLKDGFASEALSFYTQGLYVADVEDLSLRQDLHRNRAEANLRLARYGATKKDVSASLLHAKDERSKQLDAKALFRAARATYALGQYEEAANLVHPQLEIAPGDADGKALFERIEARQAEEISGQYDFGSIMAKLSLSHPRVDAANYTRKTEIRAEGTLAGRGLFATEDIEQGDLVMCEKAVCAIFGSDVGMMTVMKHDVRTGKTTTADISLWRDLTNTLMDNSSLLYRVTRLQGEYAGLSQSEKVAELDGQPVIDTFQIHDILATNNFECVRPRKEQTYTVLGFASPPDDPNTTSAGLWPHTAHINHSCLANCKHTFVGDLIILRATRAIATGEELTLSYVPIDADDRRQRMLRNWGFECQCPLCLAEQQDVSEMTTARKVVKEIVETYAEDLGSAETVESLKALLRRVHETYNEGRYAGLPRLATTSASAYLMQSHSLRGEYKELTTELQDLFFALGYDEVRLSGDEIVLSAGKGAALNDSIAIIMLLRLAHWTRGNGEQAAADALDGLAKRLYVMLNGVDSGFAEMSDTSEME